MNQPVTTFDKAMSPALYLNVYELMPSHFKNQYENSHFLLGPSKVDGSTSIFGSYGLNSELVRMDGQEWVLTLGRKSGNDIVIDAPIISGNHARIVRRDDCTTLEDLTSTNGSFLNGERIGSGERVPIKPNSRIVLGILEDYNPPWIYHDFDSFLVYLELVKKRAKK